MQTSQRFREMIAELDIYLANPNAESWDKFCQMTESPKYSFCCCQDEGTKPFRDMNIRSIFGKWACVEECPGYNLSLCSGFYGYAQKEAQVVVALMEFRAIVTVRCGI